MSIASRIEQIEQHISDDYDVLELAGADLTNVDKNIFNLKQSWEERLLYFLANGTDTLWNNWEKVSGSGTEISLNNTIEAKMDFVYKGNTSQTGTPTPDNPIPVQVVSGDNTIKVEGKNLFDKDNPNIIHKQPLQDGNIDTNSNYVATYLPAKEGDVFTISTTSNLFDNYAKIWFISENPATATTWLSRISRNSGETSITATAPQNTKYVCFYMIYSNNQTTINSLLETIQVEKSNEATTYEAYQGASYPVNLGSIELCKIGTYQDKIAKSSGKNLFDKDNINIQNGYLDYNGFFVSANDWWGETSFIKIKPNTQYTFSCRNIGARFIWCEYTNDSVGSIVGQRHEGSTTFTTSNTSQYIRFCTNSTTTTDIQLNEGTTALPYEPYGKVWYLNKQIGKVVLDGSENWDNSYGTNLFTLNSYLDSKPFIVGYGLSNYYKYNSIQSGINAGTVNGEFALQQSQGHYSIHIKNTNCSTPADFKTWLSTNNTIVYYPLATPTYEKITNTTLISQLEAIKKSYNTQTSISQVNNDLPFILDVVALGELEI